MADIDFGIEKKPAYADNNEALILEQLKRQYGGEAYVPPPPSGMTLISHWPGEDSPVDIVSGHDMIGADDSMNYPVAIAPHYDPAGVVGKAFDFHLGKVRGITPATPDLNIFNDSEFTIEGYFKVGADEGDATIGHYCIPYGEETIASFQLYPWAGGFSLGVYQGSGDKYLFFHFLEGDAWTPNIAFHLRLTYTAGEWKCYADTIEVPLSAEGDINPAPVRDDQTGAIWFFGNWSDEIKFSKQV